MAQLIVSLEGLKLANLAQVVTARGIDRVLVVDTPTGFAEGGIAGVASAAALRTASNLRNLPFQFALAGGEAAVTLSAPVYSALVASGFSFVNDPGLKGFTDALVVTAESVVVTGDQAAVKTAGSGQTLSYQLTAFKGDRQDPSSLSSPLFDAPENGAATSFSLSNTVGSTPTIVSDGGWSAIRQLSNLNGTVKVNLSASEFQEIARRNGLGTSDASAALITVTDTNDIQVGPAGTPLAATDNAGALQLLTLPLPIAASSGGILSGAFTTTNPTAGVGVITEANVSAQATGVTTLNNYITSAGSTSTTQITVNGFRITGDLIRQLSAAGKQLGNYTLSGESAAGNSGKYLLINAGDVTLTAKELRSLPAEGVLTVSAGTVNGLAEASAATRLILSDSAANISLLLPQLTTQQLGSIAELKLTDRQPVQVSVARLKELDTASSVNTFDTTAGLLAATDVSFAVSGSLRELLDSGLIGSTGVLNGYWAGSSNAAGTANLVSQIKCVEVSLEMQSGNQPLSLADLDRLRVLKESLGPSRPLLLQAPAVSLTVDGYQSLLEIGAVLPPGRFSVVDTPARIAELLLAATAPEGTRVDLSALAAISSSDPTGVAELSFQQYLQLQGAKDAGSLPAILAEHSFVDVQFVVSGTAREIEDLFSQFGDVIAKLNGLDSFSFRITDGGASSRSDAGETVITAAVLDRLDGRIEGAVAVVDSSANIAAMLEKKIPDVVKDIQVKTAAPSGQNQPLPLNQLVLTVAQFRNLPAYANPGDGVVIRDSEINIIRALSFGTLDDRVVGLAVTSQVATSALPADGALTLTAATARQLGDRWVQIDGVNGSGQVVIRDRGAAIADYIETASLPNGGAINLRFVEASGQTVVLNADQSAAYLSLSDQISKVTGVAPTWGPASAAFPVDRPYFLPAEDVIGGLRAEIEDLAELVGLLGGQISTQIAGVITALGQAEGRIKQAGIDGDVLTRTALTTAKDALIVAIGQSETELATDIAGVITALGQAEDRIKQAGIDGDVLTRTALTTAKDALIVAIGQSETELATDIAGVITALGQAEDRIKQAGIDGDVLTRTALTTAKDALIVAIGQSETELATDIAGV
ncbi:hypothetical protein KBZ14_14545, partial [Synechococcus sp. HJ21-Hayes]|uniref:hypothetical protein n=1 Tax=unclassified Synechococcus TaxID=2626047 RepID=UPI0020CD7E24